MNGLIGWIVWTLILVFLFNEAMLDVKSIGEGITWLVIWFVGGIFIAGVTVTVNGE